jgi:DNA-binding YbaB/EbfC family protein
MKIEDLMKQAAAMQEKLAGAQARVETLEADGVAGGGLVVVTLHNKGVMKRLVIDKSLLKADEGEILEDLIMAAHAAAKAKLDQKMNEEMQKMTAGLALPPGFKMPF